MALNKKTKKIKPKNDAKLLVVYQRRIARFLMIGLSVREIAERLNRTPGTIRALINRDSFDEIAENLEREINKTVDLKIQGLFDIALKRLKQLILHPNPQVSGQNIDRILKVRQERMKELAPFLQQQVEQNNLQLEDQQTDQLSDPSLDPAQVKNAIDQLIGVRELMQSMSDATKQPVVDITPVKEEPKKESDNTQITPSPDVDSIE